MPYVGGVTAYKKKCDEVAAKGYEGFRLGPWPKHSDLPPIKLRMMRRWRSRAGFNSQANRFRQ